ncbi:hypothetical protein M405DRAFT_936055, partial [Rhizopogon salebrosus TDB-379]
MKTEPKQQNTKYLDREIPRQRRMMVDGHMPHIARSRRGVTHSRFQSSADPNSFSSTRLHAVQRFFNRTQPSADTKGKQKPRLTRRTPEVVDVPLGQATVGDYVAGKEDGVRLYSLFFCLGWFQKNEKTPDPPRQLYDDDLGEEEDRIEYLNVPIPTTRIRLARQEDIELTPKASRSQSEAGPSCAARGADTDRCSLRSPSYVCCHYHVLPVFD